MKAATKKHTPSTRCALTPKKELLQYRRLFEALPDIVYKVDSNGVFTYISESIRDLGYLPDELIGKHFSEIVHPKDLQKVSRRHVLPHYRGKNTGDEHAPKLFDERRTGMRGTKGLVVRLVPNYLKKFLEAHPLVDTEDQFYGEIISYGDFFPWLLQPNQRQSPQSRYAGVVYAEVSSNGHYTGSSQKTAGSFDGTVGMIRNITERVVLSRQKAHLEEQLQHMLRIESLGQLTIGLAHDLNNVLCNSLGYAELIKDLYIEKQPANVKHFQDKMDVMIGSLDNGIELVRNILNFSRKTRTKSETLNVHTLTYDVVTLLHFALGKLMRIVQKLDAQKPFIQGNSMELENVLINLALNARDAMPHGGEISFTTETVYVEKPFPLLASQKCIPGEYVVISVADKGTGIDEKVRARLFEPFFTTKPEGKGTGLGLMNVLRTVKNHNGFVDVESKLKVGTIFRLYLPVTAKADSLPAKPGSEHPKEHLQNIGSKILVIDDDASICEVVKLALNTAGCKVTACTNPLDAIKTFRKHKMSFDCICIDFLMPQMNGVECFRRLKKIRPDIPALLISGLGDNIDESLAKAEGFIGVVSKPFNIKELVHKATQCTQKQLHPNH